MASGAVSQDGPVIGGGHERSRKPGKTAPTVEQLDAAAQSRKDSDARETARNALPDVSVRSVSSEADSLVVVL